MAIRCWAAQATVVSALSLAAGMAFAILASTLLANPPGTIAAAVSGSPHANSLPMTSRAEVTRTKISHSRLDPDHSDTGYAITRTKRANLNHTSAVTTHWPPSLARGDRAIAPITFYYCERATPNSPIGDGGNFCGHMRNGDTVYPGAAACDYTYLGQRFRIAGDPTGRSYTCTDTGSAVHGLHRDIWFQTSDEGVAWQHIVGRHAEIEILRDHPRANNSEHTAQ